jgi:DsbC/DsbD-like thiol-disulfide interchange protein
MHSAPPFCFQAEHLGRIQTSAGDVNQEMKHDSKFRRLRQTIGTILVVVVLTPPAFAQTTATGPHTSITLVADHDAVAPGMRFAIGLYFQLEKGWHIYWVNPGDSGEPPKVQWQSPPGFHIGEIEWPAPQKLIAPSIVDYGYANEVLLIAPVSVSERLKRGATATIEAKVDWLVCREMCMPGKSQLSLTLPVNAGTIQPKSESGTPDRALFRESRAKIPRKAPASWRVSAISEKDDFVLKVETGTPERAATFFPLEAEQIDNDAPQAEIPFAKGVRLRLKKSDGLLKPIVQLRGVLELGAGHAYEIVAPVQAAK